jgi:hypothetical protein
MNKPYIEICDGPQAGTRFRLLGAKAIIGRGSDCDIRLEGVAGVSRQHAEVILQPDGKALVRDLGSQNGTLVNGRKVEQALAPFGCKLKIGQTTLLLGLEESAGALPEKARAEAVAAGGRHLPEDEEERLAPLDAELLMLAAGKKSRPFFFMIVFALIALSGGLYVVSMLSSSVSLFLPPYKIISIREVRVLPIATQFAKFEVEGKSTEMEGASIISVEGYSGMLKDVIETVNLRNRNNGNPALEFLLVKGEHRGNALLRLRGRDGGVLVTYPFLVRGAKPPVWQEDISHNEAAELAVRLIREADVLAEDGEIFLALKYRAQAATVYKEVIGDGLKASEIYQEFQVSRKAFTEKLSKIFETALDSAFTDNKLEREPKFLQAFELLEEAKRLVPDEESEEWQILTAWQDVIRKQASVK